MITTTYKLTITYILPMYKNVFVRSKSIIIMYHLKEKKPCLDCFLSSYYKLWNTLKILDNYHGTYLYGYRNVFTMYLDSVMIFLRKAVKDTGPGMDTRTMFSWARWLFGQVHGIQGKVINCLQSCKHIREWPSST